MCGIAGVWVRRGPPPSDRILRNMIDLVGYRGPDEQGVLVDSSIGLAHARLSIIDLSHGQQPMSMPDGSLHVVFNGEIFNHIELREQLEQRGHVFRTRSDTEVVLRAYAEYGTDCVEHFNGQWAIAIWDRQQQYLFLSRDRIGIRPLFYAEAGGAFLFASEIKSILAYPDMAREIDLQGLNQVFTFWTTLAQRTLFRGIQELPPGHTMVVRQEGPPTVRQYWQLSYPTSYEDQDEETVADELLDLLVDATRLRLRSDVPVGAYLSGGLDSSIIVALIRNFTDTTLDTFSITFADAEFDESRFQQDVVERFRTTHHQVHCAGETIGEVFRNVIWHTERPLVRTAPAPMYWLAKLVHDHQYKVVLTGEGADEMFGGYDIFKEAKIRRFWARQPDSTWRPLLLKRLYPYMPQLQAQSPEVLKGFFHIRAEQRGSPFFSHLPRWELTAKLKGLFTRDVMEACKAFEPYEELLDSLPASFRTWDPFCQGQYLESTGLLPGYILSSQGDRMAMAHSVEGRFPFLDYRVMEYASKLSPKLKMNVLDEKYLLKRIGKRLIPPSVCQRPKQPYRAPDVKSFFDTDNGKIRFAYVEHALSSDGITKGGLFAPRAVESLTKKCMQGRAIGVKDNMAMVAVLSTQLLLEQFVFNQRERPNNGDD